MHAVGTRSGEPCLVLEGLSKYFGGLGAIREVNLAVYPGERKGLIGPNGAGKTTLFNLVTGILPPSAGRIVLFGKDVSRWPSYRRVGLGMARTFQITTLFPQLTVYQNVILAAQGLRPMKFTMWRSLSSYGGVNATVRRLLETAGYWERRDMEVRHLSHGDQRQIEILLALASGPKLLLLDEPVAGLSIAESKALGAFLKRLDPELTILMIEHDMDIAFSVVDSIAVLHGGELVEEGSPAQIRDSRRVRELYLGTA